MLTTDQPAYQVQIGFGPGRWFDRGPVYRDRAAATDFAASVYPDASVNGPARRVVAVRVKRVAPRSVPLARPAPAPVATPTLRKRVSA